MLMETASPSTLVGVIVFLTILDVIVVFLNFYTKRVLKQTLKSEDWLAILALICVCGLATTLLIGISHHVIGYPDPEYAEYGIVTESARECMRINWVFHFISIFALWFIKSSFLFLYQRIFVIDKRDFKDAPNVAILVTFGIVSLWTLGFGISALFMCHPISTFLQNAFDETLKCYDSWMWALAFAISDFLIDITIIVLPIPMVWRLHLPIGRKIAVISVFLLGALAVAASTMRLVRMAWAYNLPQDTTVDQNLMHTTMLFWAMIEANLGLIAACLPTLRGLFRIPAVERVFGRYRTKFSSGSGKSVDGHVMPFSHAPGQEQISVSKKRHMYPEDITLTTIDSGNSTQPVVEHHRITPK